MAVSPKINMAYIVTLYGGTPWGFRIKGGIDTSEPIQISTVNPNSKAFREGVQVGDIIYKINGEVVDGLTLVDAQKRIKAVGNTLELELKRGEDGVDGPGTAEANKENQVKGQTKQVTNQKKDDMFKSSTSISVNHHPSGEEYNDTAKQETARAERARMRLLRREAARQQQQQQQHSSQRGAMVKTYKPVSFTKGADSLSNRSMSSQSSGMTMQPETLMAKELEFEKLANFDEPVTNDMPISSVNATSDKQWQLRRESATRDEQSSRGAKMFMKMQEKARAQEDERPQSPIPEYAPYQQGQQQPSSPWQSQSFHATQHGSQSQEPQTVRQRPSSPWGSQGSWSQEPQTVRQRPSSPWDSQGSQSREPQPVRQRPSSPWGSQSFDGPQHRPSSPWRSQSHDQQRPTSPMINQSVPQQQRPSSPWRSQSHESQQRPASPMVNQSIPQQQRPSSPWRSQSFEAPQTGSQHQHQPRAPSPWQKESNVAKPPHQRPLSPWQNQTQENKVQTTVNVTAKPTARSSSVPARVRSAPTTPRGQAQPPSAVVPPMPSGTPTPVNRAPTPPAEEVEEEVIVPVKDRIRTFRNIEASHSPTRSQQKPIIDFKPTANITSQPSTPTWNVRSPSPVGSWNKPSSTSATPSTPSGTGASTWGKPTSTWEPSKPPSTPTWSSQTLPHDFKRSDSLPPSLDPVPLKMTWKKREEEKNEKNLDQKDDGWRSVSRDFLTMTIPRSPKVESRLQNGDEIKASEAPSLKASQSSPIAAPRSNISDTKPGVWTPGQPPPDLSNDLEERRKEKERDEEQINDIKSVNKIWTPSGTLPKDFRSVKLEITEKKTEPQSVKFESIAPRESPKVETLPPREPPAAQTSIKASSLPEFVEVAGIKYWREPEVSATKSEVSHAPPPERTVSTPSLPASTNLAQSSSKPFSAMNGSISSLDGRLSPTLHLPKTQTPAITLLQKYREGQIPKGAIYVGSKDTVDGDVKHTDTYYILPSGEKQVTSTTTEKKAPKYEGIGPTNESGIPTAVRSTIDEKSQHDWYKTFYKTLHKTEKPRPGDLFRNEGVFIDSEKEENTYHPTYTFPEDEPAPKKEDADTLERDRMKSYTHESYGSKGSSTWSPAHARSKVEIYRNHPRRIEDYEPGYSSIADKEIQTDFPNESTFYNPPIEKPGQNSQYILDPDGRLPTKSSERSSRSTSPTVTHEWYKQVLKGGEIPLEGFRKPYPERRDSEEDYLPQQTDQKSARAYEKYLPQDQADYRSLERPKPSKNKPAPPKRQKPLPPPKSKSAAERLGIKSPPPFNLKASQRHHHSTSDLPSHKSPVNTLERQHSATLDRRRRDEEEARRKEYLRQITEEEKRRRAEEEHAKNEARKHSDFFSPKQKSPIPLDRFEDLENMAPMNVPTFDKKHRPTEIKGKAKALYSFKAQSHKELSFRKGDIIYLTRQIDKNWFEGEHHGHRGIFPINYVDVTKTLEEARAIAQSQEGHARVKYTFKKQSPVELSARKGAIATLIRRVDENWYEAKIDGLQGIIPVSYLDIQREPETPFVTPAPSAVPSAAPSAFNTPGPGTPVRPLSPLYPDQLMSPSQQREDYFNFQDFSPHQERRQRYDSTSKDGNYNQTLDSFIDILNQRDGDTGGQRQDHSPTRQDRYRNTSQNYNPQLEAASDMIASFKLDQRDAKPMYDRTMSLDRRSMGRDGYYRDRQTPPPPQPKHEQPLRPYRAVYTYVPQNEDELDLREGDNVYVLERCDDGWFVGTSARTGQFGTFPGNYVQPV